MSDTRHYLFTGLTDTGVESVCVELYNDTVFKKPLECPTTGRRRMFWSNYLQGTGINTVSSIKPLRGPIPPKKVDHNGVTLNNETD